MMSHAKLQSVPESDEVPARKGDTLQLGLGWSLDVSTGERGAVVQVSHPNDSRVVEIVVTLSAEGPVVRTRATRVEIDTKEDVSFRCRNFSLETDESIRLTAGACIQQAAVGPVELSGSDATIETTEGDVFLHANDDVRLKGELVLLNCERPTAPGPIMGSQTALLPTQVATGSAELVADLVSESTRADRK